MTKITNRFDSSLSEIEGQKPITKTISAGIYVGITTGIQKVEKLIPDNTTEKSGTGWYPEKDEENIKKDESL